LFFLQAEDGIRDWSVTGVQTCALPIYEPRAGARKHEQERERERSRDRRPYDVRGYEGREGDTEIQTFTFPFLSLGPLTHQSCAGLTRASIPFARTFCTKIDGLPGQARQ